MHVCVCYTSAIRLGQGRARLSTLNTHTYTFESCHSWAMEMTNFEWNKPVVWITASWLDSCLGEGKLTVTTDLFKETDAEDNRALLQVIQTLEGRETVFLLESRQRRPSVERSCSYYILLVHWLLTVRVTLWFTIRSTTSFLSLGHTEH